MEFFLKFIYVFTEPELPGFLKAGAGRGISAYERHKKFINGMAEHIEGRRRGGEEQRARTGGGEGGEEERGEERGISEGKQC